MSSGLNSHLLLMMRKTSRNECFLFQGASHSFRVKKSWTMINKERSWKEGKEVGNKGGRKERERGKKEGRKKGGKEVGREKRK